MNKNKKLLLLLGATSKLSF